MAQALWKIVGNFFFFFFNFFFKFYFIFRLYITVLVLPNIKMNPPQVYTCSPFWTVLPPPSPVPPSGSSQCTSPKHPVSCIEPGLATHFIHDILHVSMPFSQIFPPSPSPTESIRLSISYKTKHIPTIWSRHWSSWHLPKGAENLCSHKNLHVDVHRIFIHIYQNLEATKMDFSRWMDK